MDCNIRKLNYEDLSDFWEIVVLAGSEGYFPQYKEARIGWFKKIMDECNDFNYFGLFQNEKLFGGMAIGDFNLNLRSSIINLSGVGMVHTDMLHKKEKVCKEMIKYFIDINRVKGINLLFLSPFRPDFYKNMGFGYGTSLYNYRIPPNSFSNSGSKENLVYATDTDKQELLNCFNRIFRNTHGAIDRNPFWLIETFGSGRRVVVYKNENKINGAIIFSFAQEKEMLIEEMFYENNEVLMSMCSFLNSQSDQFDRILFSTPDEYFYYILKDPLDGLKKLENYSSTIDNMFRVINVKGIFQELSNTNFNDQNVVLDISLTDSFFPENCGTTTIEFKNGWVKVLESSSDPDKIEISLDISDFSSLIVGSVSIKTLHRLGLCKISDQTKLDSIDKIFIIGQKPLCTVHI